MWRRSFLGLPLPLLLRTLSARAQEAPTFRAETLVVEVPVVVRKRGGGSPVEDLRRDEFQLLVNGSPTAIEWFSVARSGRPLPPPEPLPALPQGFVRNRASDRDEGGRVVALVVDTLNARFEDTHYAVKGAISTLESIDPNDRVGLYVINRLGAVAVHDFSDDRAELLRRLRSASAIPDLMQDIPIEPPAVTDTFLTSTTAGVETGKFKARMQLMFTLRGLQGIAEHLSFIPGRKALIWTTAGFHPTTMLDNLDLWNRAVERISAANVAVYGVDSAGMRTITAFRAEVGVANKAYSSNRRYMDPVHEMADRTGGRPYRNTNNISGAIREAIGDSEVVYTLGFIARDEKWNGAYRRIRVRVARKGLDVRHRDGYLARLPKEATDEECDRILENAMLGSVHATALPLAGRVEVKSPPFLLHLHIEPQGVPPRPYEGLHQAEFRLRVVTRDPNGEPIDDFTDTLAISMSDAELHRARTDGIRYMRPLPAGRDAGTVKVAVMNRANGQIGSITVPARSASPGKS